MGRITLLIGMLALCSGAHAYAGEPRWALWGEGGWTRIHDDDRAGVGALRLQRDLDSRRMFRVQAGLVLSLYGAVDLGVEAHPWPGSRVSPFVGAGLGLMGEEDYGGPFFRGTAGLQVMLSRSVLLRGAVQAGTHDGQAGPHLATIGLGWRF
ncbi:MAG TPA: hypothetical protein VFQ51_10115 [Vicinamibacteria bacterium]|nr:hypothetical protein [Vicinamibacteria bacterium]